MRCLYFLQKKYNQLKIIYTSWVEILSEVLVEQNLNRIMYLITYVPEEVYFPLFFSTPVFHTNM